MLIINKRLSICRLGYKELASHHTILTTCKKLNKLKINRPSQIQQKIEVTRQVTAPKIGERGSQLTASETHQQQPTPEPVLL